MILETRHLTFPSKVGICSSCLESRSSYYTMRIENNRIIESTGMGSITITPEDEEDIWEVLGLQFLNDM